MRAIAVSQPAARTEAQTGYMTTTAPSQVHEINRTDAHRRQLRMLQLIFAGAAAIAMLALFDAARPDTTQSVFASRSVHLIDQAFPETPPSVIGGGGFAADDSSDQAQQQAEQEAEQQQALANQEAQQAEQQGRQVWEQANNP